jgi:hypothetical protein
MGVPVVLLRTHSTKTANTPSATAPLFSLVPGALALLLLFPEGLLKSLVFQFLRAGGNLGR